MFEDRGVQRRARVVVGLVEVEGGERARVGVGGRVAVAQRPRRDVVAALCRRTEIGLRREIGGLQEGVVGDVSGVGEALALLLRVEGGVGGVDRPLGLLRDGVHDAGFAKCACGDAGIQAEEGVVCGGVEVGGREWGSERWLRRGRVGISYTVGRPGRRRARARRV